MYPLCRPIRLWMVWGRVDLFDSQQATHGGDYLPAKLGALVGHQPLGETKYGEIVVVQNPGGRPSRVVLGHICLHIAGEVIPQ